MPAPPSNSIHTNDEARSLRDWINRRTAQIIKDSEGFPQRATTMPTPSYHFGESLNGTVK